MNLEMLFPYHHQKNEINMLKKIIFILIIVFETTLLYPQFKRVNKVFIPFESKEYKTGPNYFLFRPNDQVAISKEMKIAIAFHDNISIFDIYGSHLQTIKSESYKSELCFTSEGEIAWLEHTGETWPYSLTIFTYNTISESYDSIELVSLVDWFTTINPKYSIYENSKTMIYNLDTNFYKYDLFKPSLNNELLDLYLCKDSVVCLAIPNCFKVFSYYNIDGVIKYNYNMFISNYFDEWSNLIYFNFQDQNNYAIYFKSDNNLYFENLTKKEISIFENKSVPYTHYKKVLGANIIYYISDVDKDGFYIELLSW